MKVEMIVKRKKVEFEALVDNSNCRLYGAMRYDKTEANPIDWLDSSTLALFLTDVFAKIRDHKESEMKSGKPSTHGYSRIVEFRCEPIETTAILVNTPYEPEEKETTTKQGETNEMLSILRGGVTPWNAWRRDNPEADIDLRGVNLRWAHLRGADLSKANLSGANFLGADLRKANLSKADLLGADLRGADLRGANFRGANFRGANLSKANLSEADLSEANLSKANLKGANLSWACLRGANREGAIGLPE